MKILIPLIVLILSGCAATVPVAPATSLITVTPDMIKECPALLPFVGKTEADAIAYTGDVIEAYNQCDLSNHTKALLIQQVLGGKK